MIPNFFYGIFNSFTDIYLNAVGSFTNLLPSWLINAWTQTISNGNGNMAIFLPLQPHPEMHGIVASVGLLTIIGFIGTVMAIALVIGIVGIIVYFVLKIIPWNTQ